MNEADYPKHIFWSHPWILDAATRRAWEKVRETLINSGANEAEGEMPPTFAYNEDRECSSIGAMMAAKGIIIMNEQVHGEVVVCRTRIILYCTISGLTSDIATADGMYGLFDIGGGTMDGAVFYYRRENGSPRINIITALVAPLGFDVAVDSMAKSITREDIRHALQAGTSMLKLKSDDLRKSIQVHVSSVVVIARRKSAVRWADTMKKFPIYLCGGGSHSTWHKEATIGTWQSHQHGNCGIPAYQQQSLGIPTGIDHGVKHIRDWDRHLVAYGLSFPKGSLAEVVGFPKNNPVQEYAQYNTDGILDERMYERYGELL
jgi:hypothetical protein